jgi:hypothetical protein
VQCIYIIPDTKKEAQWEGLIDIQDHFDDLEHAGLYLIMGTAAS